MSHKADLTLPYSQLTFTAANQASLPAAYAATESLGPLLLHVLERHAQSVLESGSAALVSMTQDVTGPDISPQSDVTFTSEIDRKTRTLIFIGGEASSAGQPLLRATAIYRISQAATPSD